MSTIKRRSFLTLLGGAAAAWPMAARAQQAVPMIGYLYVGVPELSTGLVAAFRKGLSETGYVEGQNLAIEYRFAHDDNSRLPAMAADLVSRRVMVIAVPGSSSAALAAKAMTTTIPIVFSTGSDPVQTGLVASFNRPGGNVTGISSMNVEVSAKRFGLLHELLPRAKRFAALVSPNSTTTSLIAELQAAALSVGREIEFFTAATNRKIETAFAAAVKKRADGLLISPSSLFDNRRAQLIALAAHYRLPTMYAFRDHVEAGGLMSYGSSASDRDRQVGIYAGRILRGEKPADLPVMQAVRFEFVINLQTARLLGIDVPPGMLAIADEVIE